MSAAKSYNRIVFLTTLSLYLGLVLVGGTAPVLAHSALTKSFDVRTEIEVKDDFDNQPDDVACADLRAKSVAEDNAFIESYAAYVASLLKINYGADALVVDLRGSLLDTSFPALRAEFQDGFADLKLDAENYYGSFHFKSKTANLDLTPVTASYRASLDFKRCQSNKKPVNVIYVNTTVAHENDQVFIVTRLPRAAIDSLLK